MAKCVFVFCFIIRFALAAYRVFVSEPLTEIGSEWFWRLFCTFSVWSVFRPLALAWSMSVDLPRLPSSQFGSFVCAVQAEGRCSRCYLPCIRHGSCWDHDQLHHDCPRWCVHRCGYRFDRGVIAFSPSSLICRASLMGTLLIPGICAVISEKPLEIRSAVFMRDTIFFLLSLMGLVIFIVDGTIYGLEAIYLLVIFVGYVVCICLSPLVKRSFRFNREVCVDGSFDA